MEFISNVYTSRKALGELLSVWRSHRYQPDPSEIVILKHCQEVMLERTLLVASGVGFAMIKLSSKNKAANIVRLPLIGLSSLLGGYYGGQTVAPSCLKSIMLQDTPLAGEAMAILEQLAPDSSMLRRAREAHQTSSGSLEAVALPRVAAAAAQQRAQSTKNDQRQLPTKDVSSANKEDAWSDTNSALDLHINWGDNDAEGEPQAPRRQPRRSVHEQMIAEKAAAARAARANGEEITFERRRRNQYGDTWDTA